MSLCQDHFVGEGEQKATEGAIIMTLYQGYILLHDSLLLMLTLITWLRGYLSVFSSVSLLSYCIFLKKVTMCSPCSNSEELCSTTSGAKRVHKPFRILYERFPSFPSFIYLFDGFTISLDLEIYSVFWVIIQQYFVFSLRLLQTRPPEAPFVGSCVPLAHPSL